MDQSDKHAPIVGVWEVIAKDAPFPRHMFTFTPFGAMMQTNPPAGNQDESDSNGHGVWHGKHLDDGRYAVFLDATPLPFTHAVSGMVAPVAVK